MANPGEGQQPQPETNGHPAAPITMPATARDRPTLGGGRFERGQGGPGSDVEAIGGIAGRTGAKLQASTRVMNAFFGYLATVCGRPADQMTESDVATLGAMMSGLERLEAGGRRGAHG